MEEMSKKTKRLEKENLTLNRKHDATKSSCLEMAEERTKLTNELAQQKKKGEKLTSIINQMQKQGRGTGSDMAGNGVEGDFEGEGDLEGTESDYEEGYDDEEGEEGSEEGEEGEYDTEDELPKPFGPVPPPPPPTNGVLASTSNGIKH